MTKSIIFTITALTTILILGVGSALAADHDDGTIQQDRLAKAIPDWVQFNMQAYLDDQISERELLDAFKFLQDKGIMHQSQEAAKQMAELRTENAAMKKKLQADGIVGSKTMGEVDIPSHTPEWTNPNESDPGVMRPHDEIMIILYPSPGAMQPEDEIMVLLRPSPDSLMKPEDELMILLRPAPGAAENDYSFVGTSESQTADDAHEKWIDVLNIDWEQHQAGAPDSFFDIWIEPEAAGDTADMTLKGKKIHENAPEGGGSTAVLTYTGLEFASETVQDLVNDGETSTTGWDEGVAAFTSKNYGTTSTHSNHELAHALGMMDTAIQKEIQALEGQVQILEELADMYTTPATSTRAGTTQYGESDFEFLSRYADQIDTKINSLQSGLDALEKMLSAADSEGIQEMQMQLQDAMNKQQNTLEILKEKTTQIDEAGEFWFTDLRPGY